MKVRAVNLQFAAALKQMRTGVTVCCWLIGLALTAQVVVWSFLTFTESRWETFEARAPRTTEVVVTPEEIRRRALQSAGADDPAITTIDVNRQRSAVDYSLQAVANVSAAVGTMASLALLPFLGLGVVLAAGSATTGVERASGAFVWAVVIVLLVLPWRQAFDAVPFAGLFPNYAMMAGEVDFSKYGHSVPGATHSPTSSGFLFYGRYLVLPVACVMGITAVGLRFRSGVEAGLLPKEDLRLDPTLESEISQIKAGSLMSGGRSAGALHSMIKPGEPPETGRSLREVSPGERPPRLI
jgi:hypothetical protein